MERELPGELLVGLDIALTISLVGLFTAIYALRRISRDLRGRESEEDPDGGSEGVGNGL